MKFTDPKLTDEKLYITKLKISTIVITTYFFPTSPRSVYVNEPWLQKTISIVQSESSVENLSMQRTKFLEFLYYHHSIAFIL